MNRYISDFEKQLKECLEGFENKPKFIGFASLREEGNLIRYSVEICKKKIIAHYSALELMKELLIRVRGMILFWQY